MILIAERILRSENLKTGVLLLGVALKISIKKSAMP